MTRTLAVHDMATNIQAVRERITAAAGRAGRDPATVTLIAVSKTFPVEMVRMVVAAGLRDLGENRVQEAVDKRAAFESATSDGAIASGSAPRPTWHLIGHLQTNKVKTALQTFDILQSIDSLRLAETVSRQAIAPVDVLLEVNVAGEATKFGVAPGDVPRTVEQVGRLEHVRLTGLMTVAPAVSDPDAVRAVFRTLRELRDAAGLTELSMGMSNDYEIAVEEGATMVRIGRAIFGERPELAQ